MKLVPLQQWICDECGKIIKKPEDGWLEWLEGVTESIQPYGFRIVHHQLASPQKGCYYKATKVNPAFISDGHLDWYLGHDGLAQLLVFFDDGNRNAKDQTELAEIIRRLHLPYYEEARLCFQAAHADGYTDGFNEYAIYMQDTMKRIIERYGDND